MVEGEDEWAIAINSPLGLKATLLAVLVGSVEGSVIFTGAPLDQS